MPGPSEVELPAGAGDESELLLAWLAYLRGAVLRKLEGLSEEQARWRPDAKLICVLGVVNPTRARPSWTPSSPKSSLCRPRSSPD